VNGSTVTRTLAYDLFRGHTGYLKDIDFVSNPDEESYLIKDEQGTVRRLVKVSFSGGVYSVSQGDVPLDAYGDWFDPGQVPAMGAHYMRYIGCRVEGYADPGTENQALLHTDHRHYYAPLGVFLQREPLLVRPTAGYIAFSSSRMGSTQPYRYSGNAPIEAQDSTGMKECTDEDYKAASEWRSRYMAECQRKYNNAKQQLADRIKSINNQIDALEAGMQNRIKQECEMPIVRKLVFRDPLLGEWDLDPSGERPTYEPEPWLYDLLPYSSYVTIYEQDPAYWDCRNRVVEDVMRQIEELDRLRKLIQDCFNNPEYDRWLHRCWGDAQLGYCRMLNWACNMPLCQGEHEVFHVVGGDPGGPKRGIFQIVPPCCAPPDAWGHGALPSCGA